jgi:GMP synthase (glutamine-hydrolysing)
MPRYRLLQAREPGERTAHDERGSFAAKLGVPIDQVIPHDLLHSETTPARITEDVDAVLVGGSGRYSIYDQEPWITAFIDALGGLSEGPTPMFASCFGFQGLVMALGGEVCSVPSSAEVGSYRIEKTDAAATDRLFSSLPNTFMAQLGHKDSAIRFPDAATLLARSERCGMQAMRVGSGPIYATQFHPELSGDENKARFVNYWEEYKEVYGKKGATEILEGFRASPHASGLLSSFAGLVEAGG